MAIMVTREPHCFQKIIETFKAGKLAKAEPTLVISNRRELSPWPRKRVHFQFCSLG